MKIENGKDHSLIKPLISACPSIELDFLKPLSQRTNINVTFDVTFYNQYYSTSLISDSTIAPKEKSVTNLNGNNYSLEFSLEKSFLKKANKEFLFYGGAGLQLMSFSHWANPILLSNDTSNALPDLQNSFLNYGNKQLSANLIAGLEYRIQNHHKNYWQFGIGLTYCLAKNMGTTSYTYDNTYQAENGRFALRGSSLSLKVGYLFQFKNPGKSNNS